jgi:hypothetical protein
VYADYCQFYLGDSLFDGDTGPGFWTDEALERKLAIDPPGFIGVATTYRGNVPVEIEICADEPNDDLTAWDRVLEASLSVPSGAIAIGGCMEYVPELVYRRAVAEGRTDQVVRSPHITVEPGTYRVRVYAGDTWTERIIETEGELIETTDEHYRIVLWLASCGEPRILYVRT